MACMLFFKQHVEHSMIVPLHATASLTAYKGPISQAVMQFSAAAMYAHRQQLANHAAFSPVMRWRNLELQHASPSHAGCCGGDLLRGGLLRGGLLPLQGDLIPWTIGQQFQDPDFPSLSGARIVRIAVHPGLNRAG